MPTTPAAAANNADFTFFNVETCDWITKEHFSHHVDRVANGRKKVEVMRVIKTTKTKCANKFEYSMFLLEVIIKGYTQPKNLPISDFLVASDIPPKVWKEVVDNFTKNRDMIDFALHDTDNHTEEAQTNQALPPPNDFKNEAATTPLGSAISTSNAIPTKVEGVQSDNITANNFNPVAKCNEALYTLPLEQDISFKLGQLNMFDKEIINKVCVTQASEKYVAPDNYDALKNCKLAYLWLDKGGSPDALMSLLSEKTIKKEMEQEQSFDSAYQSSSGQR